MTDLLELLETVLQQTGRFAKMLGGLLLAFLVLRWAWLRRKERPRIYTPNDLRQQTQQSNQANQAIDEPVLVDDFTGEISASLIDVIETNEQLRIRIQWNNPLIRNIGSCAGVFFFLVFSVATFNNVGFLNGDDAGSLFGFLFCGGVAIAAVYFILNVWMNQTVVTVDDLAVTVSTHPFPVPWFGGRIARQDIEQLYVQGIRNTTGHSSGPLMSYEVWALTCDGQRKPLLNVGNATGQRWGKQTGVDARFIEEKIEERLRIVDSDVEQELVERFHGGGGGPIGSE